MIILKNIKLNTKAKFENINNNLSIILLIVFLSYSPLLNAQNNKEEVFKQLKDKFDNLNTLNLKFKYKLSENSNENIEGTIRAKKGNKYYLNLGERILVCNGKEIWNYSIEEKTVMLSKFNKNIKELSVEDVFFNLINNSKPISYSKSIKNNKLNSLLLSINDNYKEKYKISEIKLNLDEKKNLVSLELIEGKSSKFWEIIDFDYNPDLKDTEFTFNAPKDVEIIDLR